MSSALDFRIREAFERYTWYHCIDIGDGFQTPGLRSYQPIQTPIMAEVRRLDLKGKTFLDIGCRDGLFCFEAEKMGASEILGIDNDISLGATDFLIPWLKSNVKMRAVNLYDFAADGPFDYVLFAGVLYHLRFPFFGLKRVADATKPGGRLIIETAMMATRQRDALLYCPAPEDSPYDPTSVTFYNDAGLVAALRSLGFRDVKCVHVLSEDGNTHESWEAFLSSSYWENEGDRPADATAKVQMKIARAVYTATRDNILDSHLQKYWFGTHSLNSVATENADFLKQNNFEWVLRSLS